MPTRLLVSHFPAAARWLPPMLVLAAVGVAWLPADEPTGGGQPQVMVRRLEEVPKEESSWGWIAWLMSSKVDPKATMTFGVVELNAKQSNPWHLHPNSDELLYVVSGSCEHRAGDRVDHLKAGDMIRIPPGVPHMARALDKPVRVVVAYNTGDRKFVPVDPKATQ